MEASGFNPFWSDDQSFNFFPTILCYIPFYAVTEIPFHSNDNLNKSLSISTLIVTLYSVFLLYNFKNYLSIYDLRSGRVIYIVYLIEIALNLVFFMVF